MRPYEPTDAFCSTLPLFTELPGRYLRLRVLAVYARGESSEGAMHEQRVASPRFTEPPGPSPATGGRLGGLFLSPGAVPGILPDCAGQS
jgi:hypothetical protein